MKSNFSSATHSLAVTLLLKQLIYNVVLVADAQQSNSDIYPNITLFASLSLQLKAGIPMKSP